MNLLVVAPLASYAHRPISEPSRSRVLMAAGTEGPEPLSLEGLRVPDADWTRVEDRLTALPLLGDELPGRRIHLDLHRRRRVLLGERLRDGSPPISAKFNAESRRMDRWAANKSQQPSTT